MSIRHWSLVIGDGVKRLLVVFCAVPLLAEQQQPTFKATTDLVQIDAVVVDKQGRHVRGLKASDFTLLDRGKVQAISTFEEVEHERVPAAVAARNASTSLSNSRRGYQRSDVREWQRVLDSRSPERSRHGPEHELPRAGLSDRPAATDYDKFNGKEFFAVSPGTRARVPFD